MGIPSNDKETPAVATWVYRLSDGRFLRGGFFAPAYDPATEGVLVCPAGHPDPRTARAAPDAPTGTRPATEAEVADFEAAQPRPLPASEWIARATPAEKRLFLQMALSDPSGGGAELLFDLVTRTDIDRNSPRLAAALAHLKAAGLLTDDRIAALRA